MRRCEALGADLRALAATAAWLGEAGHWKLREAVGGLLRARMGLVSARPRVIVLAPGTPDAASFPVPYFLEARFFVGSPDTAGQWGVILAPRLVKAETPDEMIRALLHGYRHGYQVEVIDNLQADRRQRIWRIAWGVHGPLGGPCPPSSSPLEEDATTFVDAVWRGYANEAGRQLTLSEGARRGAPDGAKGDFQR